MTEPGDIQVRHLFATPLVVASIDPDAAAARNARLAAMLLDKEKIMPSQSASNSGGWQSDDKIMTWGGPDIDAVVTGLRDLVARVTLRLDREGAHRGDIDWKINGWANISRASHANVTHIHPGAYWSAVYYVACDAPALGGALRLHDPRGGLPLMYCPVLRMDIQGYVNAGGSELFHPQPGQAVLFPAWLPHAVTPYTGTRTRISLAFNFAT